MDEQVPLPDLTIQIIVPQVCAMCGKPAVGSFVIDPGVKEAVGNKQTRMKGITRHLLCEEHAKTVRDVKPKKMPRVGKRNPAQGQMFEQPKEVIDERTTRRKGRRKSG